MCWFLPVMSGLSACACRDLWWPVRSPTNAALCRVRRQSRRADSAMDLRDQGLARAGHGGRGRHRAGDRARLRRREGAKVHVCDVDEAALRALAKSDPEVTRIDDRRVGPAAGRAAVRRRARGARRARRARQQRRHRRADRPGRGDRARGLGPLPRGRHHRPVQLHAARGAASAQEPERLDRQPLLGGRAARLPAAHALLGGEMGRGRLHQVAGHGARPEGIRVNAILPGIVEGDRIGRVFEAKAKARGISSEAMREEALSVASIGPRDAAADRRHDRLHLLAARPHHLGPGDLGLRRHADAALNVSSSIRLNKSSAKPMI